MALCRNCLCRSDWHPPSITPALGQCIVLSGVSGAGMLQRHQHNAAVKNTVQSPNAISMTGQLTVDQH